MLDKLDHQLWLDHLAQNRAAFEDFIAFMSRQEAEYTRRALDAFRTNDMAKAQLCVGSLDMLSNLKLRVTRWDNEQRAQAEVLAKQ